ncbi:MAG: anthranilate synthase component I [Armatimonadetes bacterium]|nr:anthranilate synthase component I [Armatimonadota bacterium]
MPTPNKSWRFFAESFGFEIILPVSRRYHGHNCFVTPNLETFLEMAKEGRPVPVFADMMADIETPLSVYWKVAHDGIHSFLLESVTGGEQLARYSMIGFRPVKVLHSKDGVEKVKVRDGHASEANGTDPLKFLQAHMPAVPVAVEGLPKFIGGAVGVLAYDFVRNLENLPPQSPDDLGVDDLAMMMCESVIVFDHAKNVIRIIALATPTQEGYEKAVAEIEQIKAKIKRPLPELPTGSFPVHEVKSNVTQAQYEGMVTTMKGYIAQGDGIQMVPSQRFSTKVDAHPVTVYRALRSLNPSPYMFLLRFEDFDVVGASPEILVSLQAETARVRPIAGTRWRGKSEAEDQTLEKELLADEKERAEHIMLVDLGRNDLGRVCEFGTVTINELMVIERYSHVMHIVSDVTGTLNSGMDGYDLVRATFPAGTVSGAPKVRAMQIIDELEPNRRGLYAGAAGYFSATGDVDLAITLRTILIKDGTAHVQAGAGVVHDSDPTKEYEETKNKARAALQALELAQRGF